MKLTCDEDIHWNPGKLTFCRVEMDFPVEGFCIGWSHYIIEFNRDKQTLYDTSRADWDNLTLDSLVLLKTTNPSFIELGWPSRVVFACHDGKLRYDHNGWKTIDLPDEYAQGVVIHEGHLYYISYPEQTLYKEKTPLVEGFTWRHPFRLGGVLYWFEDATLMTFAGMVGRYQPPKEEWQTSQWTVKNSMCLHNLDTDEYEIYLLDSGDLANRQGRRSVSE